MKLLALLPSLRGFASSRETTFLGLTRSREAPKKGLWLTPFLLLATPTLADSSMPKAALADTQLPDPKQEAAAKALMESVRCLVCQGQSIADSEAELAGDMRAMIRRRVAAGESPEHIRAWLIERYGNWVSYKPAFDAETAPLWIAPILLLGIGIFVARGRFRRRKT